MRRTIPSCSLLLCIALSCVAAHAATIVVNSDGTLSDPGFADDGQCTVFEAVAAANDNAPSGTMPGECIAGESGVIDEIVIDPAMLPAVIVVEAELVVSDGFRNSMGNES